MKLIAETAWHHEGDPDFMRELANNISRSRADIAKFHLLLDLDEYIDPSHSLYEKYQHWNLSKEVWADIFTIPNKELMILCNDTKAIEFAATFKPAIIEIHAVCMADLNMLDALIQNTSKETKIALGISGNHLREIDFSIERLKRDNIILMYGFQNYPTQLTNINFNKLKKIMKFYPDHEFGYADHCGYDEEFNELVTLTGAALGVNYIEKHVTHQPGVKRIDYEAAIGFKELDHLKSLLEQQVATFGSGELEFNTGEQSYARLGTLKKAPMTTRKISAGETFDRNCLAMKRTKCAFEFSPHDVIFKLGGAFTRDLEAGSLITPMDISG